MFSLGFRPVVAPLPSLGSPSPRAYPQHGRSSLAAQDSKQDKRILAKCMLLWMRAQIRTRTQVCDQWRCADGCTPAGADLDFVSGV